MIKYYFSLDKIKNNRTHFHDYPAYVKNLKVIDTLEGHLSCVNTVEWDKTGTRLLSGGDDLNIYIYDYFSNKIIDKQIICTKHLENSRNILSTKFIYEHDNLIISGSKCGSVFLIKLDSNDPIEITYKHSGPVLNVGYSESSPNQFVSVSTDRSMVLHDIRMDHPAHVLMFPCGLAALAFHPLDSWRVAVGGGDSFVRIFDIRTLASSFTAATSGNCSDISSTLSRTVELCRPKDIPLESKSMFGPLNGSGRRFVSGLSYDKSSAGRYLLASYMYDNIYMFNTALQEDNLPQIDPDEEPQRESTQNSFQIQYNWSDTGPPTNSQSQPALINGPSLIQNFLSSFQRARESSNRENSYLSASFIKSHLESVKRYKQVGCFKGLQNFRTMIKDVLFWGKDYVMSGSECGNILIWKRGNIYPINAVPTDGHVTNRICPHPYIPILASCGLDKEVKIIASDMTSVEKQDQLMSDQNCEDGKVEDDTLINDTDEDNNSVTQDSTNETGQDFHLELQQNYNMKSRHDRRILKTVSMNHLRTERAKSSQCISMVDLLRMMQASRLLQRQSSS